MGPSNGPLRGLINLADLSLRDNQVNEIGPLAGLLNLKSLNLWDNQVTDIYPLVENPGVDDGDSVFLFGNPLSISSCNVYIPELENRGVTVSDDCT